MQFPIYILIYVEQKLRSIPLFISNIGTRRKPFSPTRGSVWVDVFNIQHSNTKAMCVCVCPCMRVCVCVSSVSSRPWIYAFLSIYEDAFAKCLNSLCLWYPDAFCEIEGGICICLCADVCVCLCIQVIIWDGEVCVSMNVNMCACEWQALW